MDKRSHTHRLLSLAPIEHRDGVANGVAKWVAKRVAKQAATQAVTQAAGKARRSGAPLERRHDDVVHSEGKINEEGLRAPLAKKRRTLQCNLGQCNGRTASCL